MNRLAMPCVIGVAAMCHWSCSDDGETRAHTAAMRDAAAAASHTPHAIDASPAASDASFQDAASTPAAAHDAGGSTGSGGDAATMTGCDAPGLTWKTANKTSYTSYPDPGSEECIKYSGCDYEGMFAACDDTKSESWVKAHDIVAAFPDFDQLQLHDLCLRSGSKTIVVTVVDTCADSDCDGCCTQNKGSADELIDVESYTDARWSVEDGPIDWADLGPTAGRGCE